MEISKVLYGYLLMLFGKRANARITFRGVMRVVECEKGSARTWRIDRQVSARLNSTSERNAVT
jgi:hypothetical protein